MLKLRRLPQMDGRKFNVTPVDWVAKAGLEDRRDRRTLGALLLGLKGHCSHSSPWLP